ncbi:MAG: ATPase [Bryobacterales bacterium]|mgnify:CR=1 FL=1|nr:ATPase [Bryobacterales bacterium]
MKLFLGVDGGQSSTTALIGDETGRVLGRGQGGPCNHVGAAEGRKKFTGAIEGCVSAACEQAGLDPRQLHFESACLGFSGGPADKEPILREILSSSSLTVTTDALIALVGATGGQPGVITISGTGSISFGRGRSGKTARAGGWGYIFGDEGGGFDLTRQALRSALRFEEGWGPPTSLHGALLAATRAEDANDLLHRFYTTDYPRPVIAGFSKLVDEAACSGDQVAREILMSAAQQLASITAAVRGQLFQPGEAARVAYIGGVFKSRMLLERFRSLVELEDGNLFGPPEYGPAAGALIEAYRTACLEVVLSNLPDREK